MQDIFSYYKIKWCAFSIFLLLILPGIGLSQEVDKSLIQNLSDVLQANNVAEIEQAAQNNKEYIVNLACAYRAYELKIHQSEKRLFSVLPSSFEEFNTLYSLTFINFEKDKRVIRYLYEEYFEAVFSLAPKYPEEIRRLFALVASYYDEMNGTEAIWFCDLLSDLYQKAPREYLLVLADESIPSKRILGLSCAAECRRRCIENY